MTLFNMQPPRGFYHVGRGSGANSIVAYCLGITDVDPIELNLYFKRFLNSERTSPPNFDVDFSYTDRDEIMDYVFKRFGAFYLVMDLKEPFFIKNELAGNNPRW